MLTTLGNWLLRFLGSDQMQTIIRTASKLAGGYLLAKGFDTASTDLIVAGGTALATGLIASAVNASSPATKGTPNASS